MEGSGCRLGCPAVAVLTGCGRRRLRPPRKGRDDSGAGAAGRALAIDTHTIKSKKFLS